MLSLWYLETKTLNLTHAQIRLRDTLTLHSELPPSFIYCSQTAMLSLWYQEIKSLYETHAQISLRDTLALHSELARPPSSK